MLFGSVLALDDDALMLIARISAVTLIVFAIIARPLLDSIDPGYAGGGRSEISVHLVFMGVVVLNLVGGFHALGTLMAVGLMMPRRGRSPGSTTRPRLIAVAALIG